MAPTFRPGFNISLVANNLQLHIFQKQDSELAGDLKNAR